MLEYGGATLDAAISDTFHVDEHIARTYKLANHEQSLDAEACRGVYATIAVEIMRAVNFYSYNHPGSTLQSAWLCGGGTRNAPLVEQLRQTVSLELSPISGLLPPIAEDAWAAALFPAAIGVTQQ